MKRNLAQFGLSFLASFALVLSPAFAAKATVHNHVIAKNSVKTANVQKTSLPVAPSTKSITETFSDIEQSVFHRSYIRDKPEARLCRLESFLYGETRPLQSIDLRLKSLRQTLPGLDREYPTTHSDPEKQIIIQPNEQEDDSSDALGPAPEAEAFTPQVVQGMGGVEHKVYGRTYSQEPPESRMNRLEMRLFNTTAPEMTPEERLYRVASILKAQDSAQEEKMTGHGFVGLPTRGMNSQYGQFAGSQNGLFINGTPMSPYGGGAGFYGGAFGAGSVRRSGLRIGTRGGTSRILPSLLIILLQSLL